MATSGQVAFANAYELAPIILVNGIAANASSQGMSILSLLQPDATDLTDTSQFFAHFKPLPGSSLIENDIAEYPFANQIVAANAIIARPLRLSMLMTVLVNSDNTYADKAAIISALKSSLDNHIQQGGSFTINTPSFIYTNCLLVSLIDVSTPESVQAQNAWQWNFEQPLLTLAQAQGAQNALNNRIAGGLPVVGQPATSGPGSATNAAITGNSSVSPDGMMYSQLSSATGNPQ